MTSGTCFCATTQIQLENQVFKENLLPLPLYWCHTKYNMRGEKEGIRVSGGPTNACTLSRRGGTSHVGGGLVIGSTLP
ncbi:hypothetical protein L596_016774 [Steinernema carpocapsae]|uniref:Uncharacterized protein n=1 Tax=Steinernema carpocapsae TaxID=34508 RepID=A0A4U5NIW5_STECR|nr:hypothetical protein L596_016774 [Steinernema carpocapsae]